MKPALIAVNARYNHTNPAVRSLMQTVPEREVFLLEAGLQDKKTDLLAALLRSGADVFGFSVYIWNRVMMESLTKMLRAAKPDAVIFWGGPEATGDTEKILETLPVDFVVRGEAEAIFPDILKHLETGGVSQLRETLISGIVFPGDPLSHTEPVDVSALLPADPALIDAIENRIVYLEGQRGCPFSCAYCVSGEHLKLRLKEPEQILKEAISMKQAGAKLVKFVDRTFNADRRFAKSVLKGLMMEEAVNPGNTRFHFEISADLLDEELTEIFCSAPKGLFQIEAGVQSTDETVLDCAKRRQDLRKLFSNVEKIIQADRTHVHLDLIIGLPKDTLSRFETSFNDCIKVFPQMLQLGFLKLLPGTDYDRRKEDLGIITMADPPYEIIRTPEMSALEICMLRDFEHLFDLYYNEGNFRHFFKVFNQEGKLDYTFFQDFLDDVASLGRVHEKMTLKTRASLFTDYLIRKGMNELEAKALLLDMLLAGLEPDSRLLEITEDLRLSNEETMARLSEEETVEKLTEVFHLKRRSPKYLIRDLTLVRLPEGLLEEAGLYALSKGSTFRLA